MLRFCSYFFVVFFALDIVRLDRDGQDRAKDQANLHLKPARVDWQILLAFVSQKKAHSDRRELLTGRPVASARLLSGGQSVQSHQTCGSLTTCSPQWGKVWKLETDCRGKAVKVSMLRNGISLKTIEHKRPRNSEPAKDNGGKLGFDGARYSTRLSRFRVLGPESVLPNMLPW